MWPLNDRYNVSDTSVYGENQSSYTITATSLQLAAGPYGYEFGAMAFSSSSMFNIPDNSVLSAEEFMMMGWFRIQDVDDEANVMSVLFDRRQNGRWTHYIIMLSDD